MVYPMESLCDLLFEVSNEDRLRILLQLEEGGINVTNLSRKLGISTQEVSRHISRLSEVGLTTKDPAGVHRMTSFGARVDGVAPLSHRLDSGLPYKGVLGGHHPPLSATQSRRPAPTHRRS